MKVFYFMVSLILGFFIINSFTTAYSAKSQDSNNLILEEFRNKFREEKAFYPKTHSDKFCFNTWSVKKNGKDDY